MLTDPSTEVTESVETTANPADASTNAQSKFSSDEKKAQILESFQTRLDSGELTLEEVEARQPWVAEAIKSKKEKKAEEAVPRESHDRLKAELKEELALDNEIDLVERYYPSKSKLFQDTVEKYKGKLGITEARNLAREVTGVDTSAQTLRRQGMRLRELGDGAIDADVQPTTNDHEISKLTSGKVTAKQVVEMRTTLEDGGKLILN